MQLIPIVEHEESKRASTRSVSGTQYGRFLVDVFEEWARNDVGDVFVQMFDTSLAHWMGMDQAGHVRPRPHVRRRRRAGAQRRPVLLRPLRGS